MLCPSDLPRRRGSTAPAAAVALLLAGCVLRSGGQKDLDAGPAGPPPQDFSEVIDRTRDLIDNTDDADRRSRLDAIWEFANEADRIDPAAQEVVLHYLERLVTIEERTQPLELPLAAGAMTEDFGDPEVVESEELAGPEALAAPPPPAVEGDLLQPDASELGEAAPADGGEDATAEGADDEGAMPDVAAPPPMPAVDVEALLAEAAQLMERGEPAAAMGVLTACKDQPCWPAVEAEHAAARDAHVFARKELASVRFLELRGEPDVAVQRAGLLQILEELSTLRASFPESAWSAELADQLSRVQRELETLPED